MPGFTYRSYNFVDKDPIIDYLRTIIRDSGYNMKDLSEESGVSQATVRGWLYGETRRPQAASINAVLRALNYKLDITDVKSPMMIVPTPFVPVAKEPVRTKKSYKYTNVRHLSKFKRKAR